MRRIGRSAAAVLVLTLAGMGIAAAPAGAATTAITRYQWRVVPTPDVGTMVDNSLGAVSCAGGTCVAVGYTNAGIVDQTLAEQWNGTAWTVVPSQSFLPIRDSDLYGISCVTPTFCMAVGSGSARTVDPDAASEEWDGDGLDDRPELRQQPAHNRRSCTACRAPRSTFCVAVGSVQIGGRARRSR